MADVCSLLALVAPPTTEEAPPPTAAAAVVRRHLDWKVWKKQLLVLWRSLCKEKKDHERIYIKRNEKREFESDLHDIAFSAPRSRDLPSIKYATSAKKTIDYVIGIYHVDATRRE